MLCLLNNSVYFEIVVRALFDIFSKYKVPCRILTSVEHKDLSTFRKPYVNNHICDLILDPSLNVYVVFTSHHLDEAMPCLYICYNFEQLTNKHRRNPLLFHRFAKALMVWDYSIVNCKSIGKYLNTKFYTSAPPILHVPFGYHKSMQLFKLEHMKLASSRKFKWVLIGAMSPRRQQLLEHVLNKYDKRGFVTNNCWGAVQQSSFYKESLIGLNIHYYEGPTILEVHRIMPLVANGVLVVSEHSNDKYYDHLLKDIVTFVNGNGILHAIDAILRTPDEKLKSEILMRKKRLIEKCNFEQTVNQSIMPFFK